MFRERVLPALGLYLDWTSAIDGAVRGVAPVRRRRAGALTLLVLLLGAHAIFIALVAERVNDVTGHPHPHLPARRPKVLTIPLCLVCASAP